MCCVVFYLAYTFPKRKVKSGVGELREGSLVRIVEPKVHHIRVGYISVDGSAG